MCICVNFFIIFLKNNSQPHASLHSKKTKNMKTTNKHVETNVQNLHAAQAISRTPNQHVNRKMFSATEDVDPLMEI